MYLYLKIHNISGFKYLGKTKHDPFKYNGSGVIWKKHLKKYGTDITTIVLAECTSEEELRQIGLYYSNLWNIVENKEFANLIEESGQGAVPGKKLSLKHRKRISEGLKKCGKAGHNGLKGKNNPMYGTSRKGHTAKKVIYKGKIYNSCSELAKSLDCSQAKISYMIKNGKVNTLST